MSLRDATRELHHAAEEHPFGRRMAAGEITRAEWARWCGALRQVHVVLDGSLPPCLQRGGALLLDLAILVPHVPSFNSAAARCAAECSSAIGAAGAAYIFGGAHLRGGAVIRKRLEPLGLPCHHLRFEDARAANDWLTALRAAEGVAGAARAAFRSVIAIMDEIDGGGRA